MGLNCIPRFRTISLVNELIPASRSKEFSSPGLSSEIAGHHLLRFSIESLKLGESPMLAYFVQNNTKEAELPLFKPLAGSISDPKTEFKWQPVDAAHAYKLEITGYPHGADRLIQDISAGICTDVPTPAQFGMFLPSAQHAASLSAPIARLITEVAYCWRVTAISEKGETLAGSQWWLVRFLNEKPKSDLNKSVALTSESITKSPGPEVCEIGFAGDPPNGVPCEICEAGYYAESPGTLVCQACPVGFDSSVGANQCEPNSDETETDDEVYLLTVNPPEDPEPDGDSLSPNSDATEGDEEIYTLTVNPTEEPEDGDSLAPNSDETEADEVVNSLTVNPDIDEEPIVQSETSPVFTPGVCNARLDQDGAPQLAIAEIPEAVRLINGQAEFETLILSQHPEGIDSIAIHFPGMPPLKHRMSGATFVQEYFQLRATSAGLKTVCVESWDLQRRTTMRVATVLVVAPPTPILPDAAPRITIDAPYRVEYAGETRVAVVRVSAIDERELVRVLLKLDEETVIEEETVIDNPWNYRFEVPISSDQDRHIKVWAADNTGHLSRQEFVIDVVPQTQMPTLQLPGLPPQITLEAPPRIELIDGQATIVATLTASDENGLVEVGSTISGQLVSLERPLYNRAQYEEQLQFEVSVPGPHIISAFVSDTDGNVARTLVTVQVTSGIATPGNSQPLIKSFEIGPRKTIGIGELTTGIVRLYQPAPAGGVDIYFPEQHPGHLNFEQPQHIPSGQQGIAFTIEAITPYFEEDRYRNIWLSAMLEPGISYRDSLHVHSAEQSEVVVTPAYRIRYAHFYPDEIIKGSPTRAIIYLKEPAPEGGASLGLLGGSAVSTADFTEGSAYVRGEDVVTVPAGESSVEVYFHPLPDRPNQNSNGTLRVFVPGFGHSRDAAEGLRTSAELTVRALAAVDAWLEPDSIVGGVENAVAHVRLDSLAGPSGAAVPVRLSGPIQGAPQQGDRVLHVMVQSGQLEGSRELITRRVESESAIILQHFVVPSDPREITTVIQDQVTVLPSSDFKPTVDGQYPENDPPIIFNVSAPERLIPSEDRLFTVRFDARDDWELRELGASFGGSIPLIRDARGRQQSSAEFTFVPDLVGVIPLVLTATDSDGEVTRQVLNITVAQMDDQQGAAIEDIVVSDEVDGLHLSVRPRVLAAGRGSGAVAELSVDDAVDGRLDFLISSAGHVTHPNFVSIFHGERSAEFNVLSEGFRDTMSGHLTATEDNQPRREVSVDLTATGAPFIESFTITPSDQIRVGESATAIVRLSAPSPQGGVVIILQSQFPEKVRFPERQFIPQGLSGASFEIVALEPRIENDRYRPVWFWPSLGQATEYSVANQSGYADDIWIVPNIGIRSLHFDPDIVPIDTPSTVIIELNGDAPPGGQVIGLFGSSAVATDDLNLSSSYLRGPDSVSVLAGESILEVPFRSLIGRPNQGYGGYLRAFIPGLDQSEFENYRANAYIEITPVLANSLEILEDSVIGGQQDLTIRIVLDEPAGSGGASIGLRLSGAFENVPSYPGDRLRYILVPPGESMADLTIPTRPVAEQSSATALFIRQVGTLQVRIDDIAQVLPDPDAAFIPHPTEENLPPTVSVEVPKVVLLENGEARFNIDLSATDDWDLRETALSFASPWPESRNARGRREVMETYEVVTDMVGTIPFRASATDSDGLTTSGVFIVQIEAAPITQTEMLLRLANATPHVVSNDGMTLTLRPRRIPPGRGSVATITVEFDSVTAERRELIVSTDSNAEIRHPWQLAVPPDSDRVEFEITNEGFVNESSGQLTVQDTSSGGATASITVTTSESPSIESLIFPFSGEFSVDEIIRGVVRLSSPAPDPGMQILIRQHPDLDVVDFPESVTVPTGALGVSFDVYARAVPAPNSNTNVWMGVRSSTDIGPTEVRQSLRISH